MPAMPEPVSRITRFAFVSAIAVPLWLILIAPIVAEFVWRGLQTWWALNPVRKLREWERGQFLVQDRDAE